LGDTLAQISKLHIVHWLPAWQQWEAHKGTVVHHAKEKDGKRARLISRANSSICCRVSRQTPEMSFYRKPFSDFSEVQPPSEKKTKSVNDISGICPVSELPGISSSIHISPCIAQYRMYQVSRILTDSRTIRPHATSFKH